MLRNDRRVEKTRGRIGFPALSPVVAACRARARSQFKVQRIKALIADSRIAAGVARLAKLERARKASRRSRPASDADSLHPGPTGSGVAIMTAIARQPG